jgi:hypothetical protein
MDYFHRPIGGAICHTVRLISGKNPVQHLAADAFQLDTAQEPVHPTNDAPYRSNGYLIELDFSSVTAQSFGVM